MRRAAVLLLAMSSVSVWRGDVRGDAGGDARGVASLAAALPACDAARAHCIAIHLHVAAGGDGLIAGADWLALQLATANRQFAPLEVAFQVVAVDALPASADHIATRRERDALATDRLTGEVIHVFITGKLDDVDRPGQVARGVTWRAHGSGHKYVIVASEAPDRVLAHELGHVFGLPHSTYAISIMNKAPRAEPPPEQRRFADPELATMRRVIERLLRDRVIADVAR